MSVELYTELVTLTDDEKREAHIAYCIDKMKSATTCEGKKAWWALAAREINARSPEQVAKMEREQGLEKWSI